MLYQSFHTCCQSKNHQNMSNFISEQISIIHCIDKQIKRKISSITNYKSYILSLSETIANKSREDNCKNGTINEAVNGI